MSVEPHAGHEVPLGVAVDDDVGDERVVGEAPQAHILATSREALRVEGEHVHFLYSLDCPPAENADLTAAEVLRYPAAQLFM